MFSRASDMKHLCRSSVSRVCGRRQILIDGLCIEASCLILRLILCCLSRSKGSLSVCLHARLPAYLCQSSSWHLIGNLSWKQPNAVPCEWNKLSGQKINSTACENDSWWDNTSLSVHSKKLQRYLVMRFRRKQFSLCRLSLKCCRQSTGHRSNYRLDVLSWATGTQRQYLEKAYYVGWCRPVIHQSVSPSNQPAKLLPCFAVSLSAAASTSGVSGKCFISKR